MTHASYGPLAGQSIEADRLFLRRIIVHLLALGVLCLNPLQLLSEGAGAGAVIHSEPLHGGRISPMLFGNFVELLDDVVPGMWAEMLNDRSFAGVVPAANWSYYDGKPDCCDREWDCNPTWGYETENPFNGARSARLTAARRHPASLTQSGLAVKRGLAYEFSGWFRADSPKLAATVRLKALLPTGEWTTLASAKLPRFSTEWRKCSAQLTSKGQTDRVVFELCLEGEGRAWADKLSLMPVDSLDGWRPDVVEAIKAARPGVIRWGGSVVDPGGYRWKVGIGDRDRRAPFPNRPWGRMDPNDVGIDEFLRLCELVEAKPLICVSFSDGPQSARDLVSYCNDGADTEWGGRRAANGHPKPYGVRLWQIGNELGDATYAKGCTAICRAIKETDPQSLVLSSYPSPALLAEAGRYLDFVCPHHYTPDLTADDASIDAVSRMVREASINARIGVTEWNVTGEWWGNDRGRLLTLRTALFAGQYLNLLHRRAEVVGLACRSNMTNSMASGMIQTSPAGLYLTPSYHVMKLYACHSKPVALTISDAVEGVDVSACASEDGQRVTVFLVNTKGEPVEMPLDLSDLGSGFTPARAEVVCDTLDRRQPDLVNHPTAPDRVRTVELPLPGGARNGTTVRLPAYSATAIDCGRRP